MVYLVHLNHVVRTVIRLTMSMADKGIRLHQKAEHVAIETGLLLLWKYIYSAEMRRSMRCVIGCDGPEGRRWYYPEVHAGSWATAEVR